MMMRRTICVQKNIYVSVGDTFNTIEHICERAHNLKRVKMRVEQLQ